jgi:hypothetical protein
MPEIAKARMSERERHLRSRLAQLISQVGFAKGSLSLRAKSCGKPTCHCRDGEKHPAWYLVCREDGKLRQLFVPEKLLPKARECLETYQKIREMLDELSEICWARLKQREL